MRLMFVKHTQYFHQVTFEAASGMPSLGASAGLLLAYSPEKLRRSRWFNRLPCLLNFNAFISHLGSGCCFLDQI